MLELPINKPIDELAEKKVIDQRKEQKNVKNDTNKSEALKGKKPTRNANSKIKVNKEAGPISPVLMD